LDSSLRFYLTQYQRGTLLLQRLLADPDTVGKYDADNWDREQFRHAADVLQERAQVNAELFFSPFLLAQLA
jgi:hypothetical protein